MMLKNLENNWTEEIDFIPELPSVGWVLELYLHPLHKAIELRSCNAK